MVKMFLNNLSTTNKEKVRDAVLVELDNIGFKSDLPKKTKHIRVSFCPEKSSNLRQFTYDSGFKASFLLQRPDGVCLVFRTPLERLPVTTVRLRSGVEVEVPAFIDDACQCIIKNVVVEGIFRKTGSAARQREIKVS